LVKCLTEEKIDLENTIVEWLTAVDEGVICDPPLFSDPKHTLFEWLKGKGISTEEDGEISRALNSLVKEGKIKLCVSDRGISFYIVGGVKDLYGVSLLCGSPLD